MNMKRMRGRNHRGSGGQGGSGGGGGGGGPVRHQSGNVPLNRNHVFDSIGPNLRVRGTSQQLFEKYLQLGRDATSSGDRVMAESYFQHAEHYFRILNAMNQAAQANPQQQGGQPGQPRRQQYEPQSSEPQSNEWLSNEPQGNEQHGQEQHGDGDGDDDDDQPSRGSDRHEARDIPIAAAPPEG